MIRISQTCTEFGRSFTLGQVVAGELTALQMRALVSSGLATWLNSVNPGTLDAEEAASIPAVIPITSVQFASPQTYSLHLVDPRRVYAFAGGRFVGDGTGLVPLDGGAGVFITGQRIAGQVVTARLVGGIATGWQWLRDGSAISGATSATYTLQPADVAPGAVVTVRPTGFVPEGRLY